MKIIFERCAAIDIAKKSVVVCLSLPKRQETRTFGTMTLELLELADWLQEHRVTHVAMESTGVYWKPLYNLFEGYNFELLLVNPRDFKAVPGRKTDVQDAEWLADLLRHGLLRGSFVPKRGHRELRELVRYRKSLIEERSREVNRLEKILEGANIKVSSVASTMASKGVRTMLRAMVAGETDVKELANMAKGRMRSKIDLLEQALIGQMGPHQRFMLAEQLSHIDETESRIERISQEIEERLRPFDQALQTLETIPGMGPKLAQAIVAEIGFDMTQFPTHKHLASWAKVCPGNNESAGKRKSGRTGKANKYLRSALVEAAHAASHTKGTYLSAQYHRLAARRGKKRAAMAVAHSILVIIYYILRDGTEYQELGGNYFDELKEDRVVRRMERRLQNLGYDVTLKKKAA